MSKPKLIYFDAPVSRGEECRLAFAVAGIEFDDVRLKAEEWAVQKPSTPFGSVPVLEIDGLPPLGQSNAILSLIGRRHGLHPKDELQAARHEAMMAYVEDLRAAVGPSMRIKDAAEKKQVRENHAATTIPTWAAYTEKQLGDGPFFAGASINVVDLKLYMVVRWFKSGVVDHIPATIFAGYPKLMRLFNAVAEHPAVKAWNSKHS